MKKAVIFGGGNIGRGFIAQLFNESGYHVTFIDVDQELICSLNERGSYRLQTVFNEDIREYRIAPVNAVNAADKDAVAKVVAAADIGATAVGAGILKFVAPNLVAGLELRLKDGKQTPLNIILCENLKNAAALFRKMVQECASPELQPRLPEILGLVDTVIGRMVPLPTPEMRADDVSLVRVEPYKELPVDKAGFVGEIPEISAMTAHDDFPVYTARKLYIHNCGHAFLAYLGYLRGHEFGYEALADPDIRRIMDAGLRESKAGIVAKYKADPAWLEEHIADLTGRFGNRSLGDTVFRLGRDPVRKLAPTDRLTSSARLAEAAGIVPENIALAIAAALCFAPTEDPVAVELQQRLHREPAAAVLQELTSISPDEKLGVIVLKHYTELVTAQLKNGTNQLSCLSLK